MQQWVEMMDSRCFGFLPVKYSRIFHARDRLQLSVSSKRNYLVFRRWIGKWST